MARLHNTSNLRIVSSTDKDVYTRKTDTWCYWCCHSFECIPVGLPVRYDDRKSKFRLSGIYCSYACVLAANKERNDARATERSMWVRMLAKLWHGIPMSTPMRVAPDRRTLKVFGGSLDIEGFRGCQEDLIVQLPPLVDLVPEDHVILSRLRQPQRVPATIQLGQPCIQRRTAPADGAASSSSSRQPKVAKRPYKIRKPAPKYTREQLQSLGIKVE